MLEAFKQSYLEVASLIPNWNQKSSRELADGFLDTSSSIMQDAYFAALACRY
jgi:hypothetical protein